VSALRADADLVEVVAEAGCPVVLMHMLGEPHDAGDPRYADVVEEVLRFLEERLAFAVAQGVAEEQVLLDPGIGFGKTLEHNLLLRHLERLALGRLSPGYVAQAVSALLDGAPRRSARTVAATVWGLPQAWRCSGSTMCARLWRSAVAGAIVEAGG
jgi:dihydropteroate synthase